MGLWIDIKLLFEVERRGGLLDTTPLMTWGGAAINVGMNGDSKSSRRPAAMSERILLGFEIPSGEPVHIPLHHLVITGMTQLSGKTTTIEALIHRSGLRAVVFKTKRGETGFETAGRTLPLYFKERSDWQYVSSLIEATLREKVKFERSWVIRACKGTHSLREVYNRVTDFLKRKKLRALDKSVFTNLQAYLELITPEIERLPTTDKIEIGPGVNVMDLEKVYHRPEVQALVIRSVMEHILEKERSIIVVVPESWKFLPQGRNTPVKVFFERFIREGAAIGNYLWLDSQDIAGVDKTPLRQVDNWVLGRQREEHEVQRTIDAIPLPKGKKPKALEIRRLKLGHFYAACGNRVRLVYVLPVGIEEEVARLVALGEIPPLDVRKRLADLRSRKEVDDLVWKEKYEELKAQNVALREQNEEMRKAIAEFRTRTIQPTALKADNEFLRNQVKELKAKLEKADEKIENQSRFIDNTSKSSQKMADEYDKKIEDLTERLQKAEKAAKVFHEFGEVLMKFLPPRVQIPAGSEIPSEISVMTEQPAISVKVERKPLSLSDKNLYGKIAVVYSEGAFGDGWFSVSDVVKAFQKHAWSRDPRISKALDEFCQWGFFEKKKERRKLFYRVKVSVEKARNKGLLRIEEKIGA